MNTYNIRKIMALSGRNDLDIEDKVTRIAEIICEHEFRPAYKKGLEAGYNLAEYDQKKQVVFVSKCPLRFLANTYKQSLN